MAGKKRFLLRIDEQLYAALERWAADELRSVNAQIEYLLTDAARRSGRLRPRDEELPAVDDEASDEAVGLPPRR